MFRRNVGGSAGSGLPMATQTKGGDGRSIRMDAPIVRTIKQADTSTKATAICISFTYVVWMAALFASHVINIFEMRYDGLFAARSQNQVKIFYKDYDSKKRHD